MANGRASIAAASSSMRSGIANVLGFAAVATTRSIATETLRPLDSFERRHNSATKEEEIEMAKYVGFDSMDALVDATVPTDIRRAGEMDMGEWTSPLSESEYLARFKAMASKNKVFKSYQGTGYYGTHVPPVILRNVLENPGWYTQYTPYQAEISQGRLESLLNYQTMIRRVPHTSSHTTASAW